jgi:hypothetical protein
VTINIPQHLQLTGNVTIGGEPGVTRLELPAGPAGRYRIAQMDDYSRLPRGAFLYQPPVSLSLRARVSSNNLPGTWGFGFWNDPFALGIGIKGSGLRMPALPEAAWFFFGSQQNDLSFSSKSPANGLSASVFTSATIPPILLPLGLPALPFMGIKPAARLIRLLAARFIHDVFTRVEINTAEWHQYELEWLPETVKFQVDENVAFGSRISPRGPLGLVIWIDNQYAAFCVDGTVRYGTQGNLVPAWLEISDLTISMQKP